MAGSVEKIYANALLETAATEERLKALLQESESVLSVFKASPELSHFLTDPGTGRREKLAGLKDIFEGCLSPELSGLFEVALEKGREAELAGILQTFVKAAKEKLGICTAYVTTPTAVTAAEKARIEKKLNDTVPCRTLEISYIVDPKLIGGMMIRVGDRVVDSSVRSKLNSLKRELDRIQLV